MCNSHVEYRRNYVGEQVCGIEYDFSRQDHNSSVQVRIINGTFYSSFSESVKMSNDKIGLSLFERFMFVKVIKSIKQWGESVTKITLVGNTIDVSKIRLLKCFTQHFANKYFK